MEAGLMKAVQCLNRSWTRKSYFRLRRPMVYLGEKYPGGNVRIWFIVDKIETNHKKLQSLSS